MQIGENMYRYFINNKELIKKYLSQYRYRFAVLLIIETLCIVLAVILPMFNMKLINLFLYDRISTRHIKFVVFYVLILLVASVCNYWSSVWGRKTELEIERDIRRVVLDKLIEKNRRNYIVNEFGEADTILKFDVPAFERALVQLCVDFPIILIKVISIWCILAYLGLKVAVLVLILQLAILLFQKRMGERIERMSECVREKVIGWNEKISNIIVSLGDIKHVGAERYLKNSYDDSYAEYIEQSMQHTKLAVKTNNIIEIMLNINVIIILCIGSLEIYKGSLGVGALIPLVQYVSIFFGSVSAFFQIITEIQGEKQQICNVMDNLAMEDDKQECEKQQLFGKIESISIKNITFAYSQENELLKNATAEFKRGRLNYIVGMSGVGKTTLLKLIEQDYPLIKGKIYGNTKDKERVYDLSQHLCLVPQDSIFYTDTVYNNIVLGKKIPIEKVNQVCKLCSIYDDIMKMEAKFDTILSKGIDNMSGGQLKRLSLARAILQDRDILLLDEPTSGLDTENALIVTETIRKFAKNKIIIAITHDMELIQSTDYVYEIKDNTLKLCI